MSEFSVEAAAQSAIKFLAKQPDNMASGEAITIACKEAGHIPHDDRAFGHVIRYMKQRMHAIERVGHCFRQRGHGTTGGNVWKLV